MIGIASAWIAELGVAYIMTTVTGSIVFLMWKLFCPVFDRPGYLHVIYNMLRWVMIFFLVPVSYIGVLICITDFHDGSTWGLFGTSSPTMRRVFTGIGCIWIIGVFVLLLVFLRNQYLLRSLKENSKIASAELQALLESCSDGIGLKKNVFLYQKKDVPSPFTSGSHRSYIILPETEEYSLKEIRIMLLHELMHIKYKDITWNRIGTLVWGIHWMNPLIWYIIYWNQKWCEAHCDYECVRYLGEGQEYSKLLLAIAKRQQLGVTMRMGDVLLFHHKNSTKERITRMFQYRELKAPRHGVMAAAMAGFIILSVTTVSAATYGVVKGQETFLLQTMEYIQEDVTPWENYLEEEEFREEDLIRAGYIEIVNEDNQVSTYVQGHIESTLSPNSYKKSASFTGNVGDHISIMAFVNPESKTVSAGIVQPDGIWRGVSNTGSIDHTFTLKQDGTYQIYIRNDNSTTVTMEASYHD